MKLFSRSRAFERFIHRTIDIRQLSSVSQKPRKVCIVGAGPAGYYTAQRLLKVDERAHVDLLEKLPVPFGLVRFGVAPDHPEVKNVINTFTQTATKYSDRCRFLGNVEVGKHVTFEQLRRCYNIIILSYGAEDDRRLGIHGEDLHGVHSAREFVGWYNGHPEYSQLNPDLSTDTAVILGHGNVALDIARILLMPIDELARTDISQHALEAIAESRIRHVYIMGRRGPLQVAFTIKEFREMTKLERVSLQMTSSQLSSIDIKSLPRPRRRLTELMQMVSTTPTIGDACRTCQINFLLSPKEILGHQNATGIKFVRNELQGDCLESQKAVPTDEEVELSSGLIIRSIGYKSLRLSTELPFDERSNVIPNIKGKVTGLNGVYCSGWVKRGPVGVIATTMTDAFETADTIHQDICDGLLEEEVKEDLLTRLNQTGRQIIPLGEEDNSMGHKTVSFAGWQRIDEEEVKRGRDKPREKIIVVDDLLRISRIK